MDIKLRARLSAYSKVNTTTSIPPNNGESTCGRVTEREIDSLFEQAHEETIPPVVDNESVGTVSYADIDSLFK